MRISRRIGLNQEYSPVDHLELDFSLRLVLGKAERALRYGGDMVSSRALLLAEIETIASRYFEQRDAEEMAKSLEVRS